jgi:cytoskeletal protein CcmA (bactofilin family)
MLGTTLQNSIPWQPASENGKSGAPATLLSVAGHTARIEGKFDISESLHVECEIAGELNVGAQLVIGSRGVVNANVKTVDAVIRGEYQGNLIATGNIEITETGRVNGNLETDSLVIQKGGIFNGNVTRRSGQAERSIPIHLLEPVQARADAV